MALPRRPYLTTEVVNGLRAIYKIVKDDPEMVAKIPDDGYDDVILAAQWLIDIDQHLRRQKRLAKKAKREKDGTVSTKD